MPRILISEPDKTPQPYKLPLDGDVFTIGRGHDNDIQLDDPSTSTHHCKLVRISGGFALKDDGSTNGIFFEDTRYDIVDLREEKTVHLGDDVKLTFSLLDGEKEILEHEEFVSQERMTLPSGESAAPINEVKAEIHLDEDENAEEKKLRTPDSPQAASTAQTYQPKKSAPMLLLVFLAVLAFLGGRALYHQQTHGYWKFWQKSEQK